MEKKTSGVRTVRALDAGQNPPQVDGSLDDRCWQQAEWQGGFVQLKPSMGEPARAHTRVAVAYDSKHIFVAFRCFNPTGPGANSRITRRDDNMDLDNAVTLYLDSFHSRRDCYYFSTNSLGTQVDGRIGDDGRSNDKSWDCTWYTASQQDSLGWTSEMAIPVAEIRFPRDSDTPWGINFRRNYPELYEISLWNESDKTWQVSRFGDLAGLDGLEKKFSAALYPYIVSLDTNTPGSDRRTVYSSGGTEVIAGADLRFNIGAAARGNLTFNPDFATIEADQEVINLTRYETFYPEKRLYFLEGAELFKNRINVFNSRRIGDIDYGLKSNGRIGKYNFAMLSARERASVGLSPASRTSVFRLQRDVLGSSTIGFLAVDRSFSGGYNRVLSTDATLYFPSHVKFTSQFVGSFPSGSGKFTKAYFLRCARETEAYHYHLRYSNYDPGFRENVNAVGFIRNDDRHELDSDIRYEWWIKKHNIEKINFFSKNNVFWSHGGALRNVELTDWVGMTFLRKWLVGFSNSYHTELYEKRYRNHHKLAEMGYNQQHWNSYGLLYIWGRNFDSDYTRWVLRANFKPGDDLSIKYSFTHLRFSPDPNKKSTNLHVLTTDYNFT
ncbi:MAG: DUF5916 domain-containing protein, partial [Gemmatimonadota bacterium]|nr:DUF5916 domain-containing protein [Gemmatimonadota bacterium]